jgi:hypothetical protein
MNEPTDKVRLPSLVDALIPLVFMIVLLARSICCSAPTPPVDPQQ